MAFKTMQSRIADFAPVRSARSTGGAIWPTRRLGQTVWHGNGDRVRQCSMHTQLCENMTSSTKPEIHTVLHCGKKIIDPRPPVICTENFVKSGHVVYEIRERTDRQTDIQTH